jgi:transcriptional regulator with XRE-family HTH domain
LGSRLREARKNAGLTLKELAEKTGLTRGYLSLVETNDRAPSKTAVKVICGALGIEEGWLVEGKGPMRAAPPLVEDDGAEGLSAPAVTQLLEFIHADAALDPFTGLPAGYRERYRERMAETEQKLEAYAADLMRALEDYQARLLLEARLPKQLR